MARAPFQVLVFPYRMTRDCVIEYAVFRRADATGGYWQAIAGGGEDEETPVEAAKREAWEEAGIDREAVLTPLDSSATVPVTAFGGFRWGPDVFVIPERCFAVDVTGHALTLSEEHDDMQWVSYEVAENLLHWDSNKNALWELNARLSRR